MQSPQANKQSKEKKLLDSRQDAYFNNNSMKLSETNLASSSRLANHGTNKKQKEQNGPLSPLN